MLLVERASCGLAPAATSPSIHALHVTCVLPGTDFGWQSRIARLGGITVKSAVASRDPAVRAVRVSVVGAATGSVLTTNVWSVPPTLMITSAGAVAMRVLLLTSEM